VQPRPIPEICRHLRTDHLELDARFDQLCTRARGGEWSDVDAVWDDFADDLEAHLSFEEHEVFPVVAETAPGGRELVRRLREQHEMIRRRLAELGVEIQLHIVRADTLDAFVAALRAHARLEMDQLYPWLEARSGAQQVHTTARHDAE
jgi:hemerythrin-like domain-containing protein